MLSPYLMVTAVTFFLVITPVMVALTPDWSRIFLILYAILLMLILMPLSPVGMIIGANIASALFVLPRLLHMLTGIQTPFILNMKSMLNTTFLAVVCGLTYLCMDPLMKAAYVLRCFYVRSQHTGEDLRVKLKHSAGIARLAIAACVLVAGIAVSGKALAQENNQPPLEGSRLSVSPSELSQALDRELESRQYAWRMPRIPSKERNEGISSAFIRGIVETLADWGEAITRRIQPFTQWLEKFIEWLLAVLVFVIGVVLWRTWKRRAKSFTVHAEALKTVPDIEKETTTAAELPEDGWLNLARELIRKGELRLALRAVFLASLAYLAQCSLIHIALYKSNFDYKQELERRAHARPGMLDIFSQNTRIYESVWYGAHEANNDLIECLIANQEKLRTYGAEK
jgi:hypothetical protein